MAHASYALVSRYGASSISHRHRARQALRPSCRKRSPTRFRPPTGRLIDAIANSDLVRAFARRITSAAHLPFPGRRDERVAPPAHLPDRDAQLHGRGDAGAVAGLVSLAGSDALSGAISVGASPYLLPRQSDHPQRAGAVLAHARYFEQLARSPKPWSWSASVTRSSMRPAPSRLS